MYLWEYSPYPLLPSGINLTHYLLGKSRQRGSFDFLCSSIQLTSGLPAVPSSPNHTIQNTFPLLDFQVDLRIRGIPNPSIPKHHRPLIIQLQNPINCFIQAQYSLSLQTLRRLKSLIFDLLRKKNLHAMCSPFNNPILTSKREKKENNGTDHLVQDHNSLALRLLLFNPPDPTPVFSSPPSPSDLSFLSFFSIPLNTSHKISFPFLGLTHSPF